MNYQFKANPKVWDDSCHKHPNSQTRALDQALNLLAKYTVSLTPAEVARATVIGNKRRSESQRLGHRELRGAATQSKEFCANINVAGALGELAFAKLFNLHWPASVNAPKHAPDVLPDFQVRTRSDAKYDLIVRKGDPDNQRFVLLTGGPVTFTYRGWIWGQDAKRPEWWGDHGQRQEPCYWVPQSHLTLEIDL